eukprot:11784693-Alexandrium_andersonii.AAC.1
MERSNHWCPCPMPLPTQWARQARMKLVLIQIAVAHAACLIGSLTTVCLMSPSQSRSHLQVRKVCT